MPTTTPQPPEVILPRAALDWSYCEVNDDHKHGPIVNFPEDYDIDPQYAPVKCMACGVSTGMPIPQEPDQLVWS